MSTDKLTPLFPGAKLMQVKEWGFPQGVRRSAPPAGKAISVIHITGNSRLPSAESEAAWRINDPANQNSMTLCVNRDGSVVQLLGDPLAMAPWSNGDVNRPDTSNRRIAQIVADGVNANVRTLVSIENVGYEPGYPLTGAQIETNARIIAHFHRLAGVAINRTSVVGHYQLNSVTRPNCPGRDKGVVDRIVSRAQELVAGDGQLPDTATEEDPKVIAELQAKVKAYWQWIQALRARKDELMAQVDSLEAELQAIKEDTADADALRATIRRLRGRVTDIKAKVADMAADVADD